MTIAVLISSDVHVHEHEQNYTRKMSVGVRLLNVKAVNIIIINKSPR